jgi:hypothetical protein
MRTLCHPARCREQEDVRLSVALDIPHRIRQIGDSAYARASGPAIQIDEIHCDRRWPSDRATPGREARCRLSSENGEGWTTVHLLESTGS